MQSMANPSTSTLGSISTPLSPGEALARLSPLKSCGVAPLRLPKRTSSSRWLHDDSNWWIEEGKTRSVSASAAPATTMPQRVLHGRHALRENVTISRCAITGKHPQPNKRAGYTPEQIASFRIYEAKSRRLSSHEYGINFLTSSPTRVPSPRPTSSSPRVLELERSPPFISKATFQPQTASTQKEELLQFPSSLHPPAKIIARRPVGSSPQRFKNQRSKSDPLLIWPLEITMSSDRARSQSPQKTQHYDHSDIYHGSAPTAGRSRAVSPWDTYDPRSSPSPRPITPPLRPGSARVEDLERTTEPRTGSPIVRFKSDLAQEPAIEIVEMDIKERRKHGVIRNKEIKRRKGSVTLSECLSLDNRKTAETAESAKEWGVWVIKALFACYFAACLWNILAAVKDSVVQALEPILFLWNFARWIVGK